MAKQSRIEMCWSVFSCTGLIYDICTMAQLNDWLWWSWCSHCAHGKHLLQHCAVTHQWESPGTTNNHGLVTFGFGLVTNQYIMTWYDDKMTIIVLQKNDISTWQWKCKEIANAQWISQNLTAAALVWSPVTSSAAHSGPTVAMLHLAADGDAILWITSHP